MTLTACMALLGACRHSNETTYVPMYTGQDTTDVMEATTAYMETLKSGNYEQAAHMLRTMDYNHRIHELTDKEVRKEVERSQTFPCLNYTIEEITFDTVQGGHNHKVRCEVEFFEKPTDAPYPNTVGLSLRPVKDENGKWRLTLQDNW